jgi:N-dimethylarginine dimethylaminohydrolase
LILSSSLFLLLSISFPLGNEIIVGETKRTNKRGILNLQLSFPKIPVYYVNVDLLYDLSSSSSSTSVSSTHSANPPLRQIPLHLKSFCSLLAPNHIIVGNSIGKELMKWIQNHRNEENLAISLLFHSEEGKESVGKEDDLIINSKPVSSMFLNTLLASLRNKKSHFLSSLQSSNYHFVTVPDTEASNCVYLNGTIIRRSNKEFPESGKVFEKIHIPQMQIELTELSKVDGAITCCSLLF